MSMTVCVRQLKGLMKCFGPTEVLENRLQMSMSAWTSRFLLNQWTERENINFPCCPSVMFKTIDPGLHRS